MEEVEVVVVEHPTPPEEGVRPRPDPVPVIRLDPEWPLSC